MRLKNNKNNRPLVERKIIGLKNGEENRAIQIAKDEEGGRKPIGNDADPSRSYRHPYAHARVAPSWDCLAKNKGRKI